jgi:hypothetical protein
MVVSELVPGVSHGYCPRCYLDVMEMLEREYPVK